MARALGIDLGTTNAVVAVMEAGLPTTIVNSEGNRLTASVVGFAKNGERLVGQLARRQAVLKPRSTVSSARRFIGRRYPDAQSEIEAHPFAIVAGPRDTIRFDVNGDLFAPEEISAQVLRKLAEDSARYLGERVTDAVITVPAGFDHAQRQATWEAGTLAGLNVLRILDEPAAAALAHGLHQRRRKTILVFDLGGATLEVSVVEVGDGRVEVKATAGDTNLGGDDFDNRVVNWIADEFQRQHGIDLRRDRQALQRLTEAAEEAKIELSSRTETHVSLPFVTSDGSGPKHLEMNLTRTGFDALTADLVEVCVWPYRQALAGARLTEYEIDEVVLVGGSTRIPAVKALVRRLTGRREPNRSVHPTEVVAKGAAIQAAALVAGAQGVRLEATLATTAPAVAGRFPARPSLSFLGANDNEIPGCVSQGEGEWEGGVVDAEYTRP